MVKALDRHQPLAITQLGKKLRHQRKYSNSAAVFSSENKNKIKKVSPYKLQQLLGKSANRTSTGKRVRRLKKSREPDNV